MRAYIIRRLLLIIPTVFLVTVIVFATIRFIPGSVLELMASEMVRESGMGAELTVEHLKRVLGLDVPVYVQYGRWAGVLPTPDEGFHGVFQGDLGRSLWTNRLVTEEILHRLPISAELGVIAMITVLAIALPVGTYSAIRQDTGTDYAGRSLAILAISIPSFWIGTIVIVYPSIWWAWSPPVEYIPLVENLPANLAQFILPGVILGMAMTGTTMRMTRTMMLEVLRQDYIRTAWSKGLQERVVVLRHALKNALIPVVSMIGLLIPIVIGGTIVIEQIFTLPGIGLLSLEAITKRDYPVISGVNLILAAAVLVTNLLTDLTYAYLDPRIHYK